MSRNILPTANPPSFLTCIMPIRSRLLALTRNPPPISSITTFRSDAIRISPNIDPMTTLIFIIFISTQV